MITAKMVSGEGDIFAFSVYTNKGVVHLSFLPRFTQKRGLACQ